MSVFQQLLLDGETIRYFDIGRGVPVVYIHGFCMSAESCENMVPTLKNRVRLIGIDLPGFGGSTPKDGLDSVKDMAVWVKRVLDALGIDRGILVGHSMGGYVALEFAKKYPKWLISLVLLHSTALADKKFKKEDRDRTIDLIARYGYLPWMTKWVRSLFFLQRVEYMDRATELCQRAQEAAVLRALAAMRDREDSIGFLGTTDIPILFLAGRHDTVITYSELRPIIIDSPTSRLVMLENAGHMGMYEDPESCADAIVSMMAYMTDADRNRF